jgi:hypothetical protein
MRGNQAESGGGLEGNFLSSVHLASWDCIADSVTAVYGY